MNDWISAALNFDQLIFHHSAFLAHRVPKKKEKKEKAQIIVGEKFPLPHTPDVFPAECVCVGVSFLCVWHAETHTHTAAGGKIGVWCEKTRLNWPTHHDFWCNAILSAVGWCLVGWIIRVFLDGSGDTTLFGAQVVALIWYLLIFLLFGKAHKDFYQSRKSL